MTEAERIDALYAEDSRRSWEQVLGTHQGRRVIWDVLEVCGLLRTTFVAGAPDGTAFNEGMRQVGLQLLGGHMRAGGEDVFPRMMAEAAVRRESIEAAARRDEEPDER